MTTLCIECPDAEDCEFTTEVLPKRIEQWKLKEIGEQCRESYKLEESKPQSKSILVYKGGVRG